MGFPSPNDSLKSVGAHRGMSSDAPKGVPQAATPVVVPSARFNVATAKMPQPPSVVEPGKGAVPIMPWDSSGTPNRMGGTLPDIAPKTRGK